MAFTIVRGGALLGIRLCKDCQDNYYQQDLSEKPRCDLCNNVIMDGIKVPLCRVCSAETGVCQGCGKAIGEDKEVASKRKRGKKNEPKIPVPGNVQQRTVEGGLVTGSDEAADAAKGKLPVPSGNRDGADDPKLQPPGRNAAAQLPR